MWGRGCRWTSWNGPRVWEICVVCECILSYPWEKRLSIVWWQYVQFSDDSGSLFSATPVLAQWVYKQRGLGGKNWAKDRWKNMSFLSSKLNLTVSITKCLICQWQKLMLSFQYSSMPGREHPVTSSRLIILVSAIMKWAMICPQRNRHLFWIDTYPDTYSTLILLCLSCFA